METSQIVINLFGRQEDICRQATELLTLKNLADYGYPKFKPNSIDQIAPVNASNIFVVLRVTRV